MKELGSTILNCGLKRSISEPSVFIGDTMIILVHVDDLMIFHQRDEDLSRIETALSKYGKIEFQKGNCQYLGMTITKENDEYVIAQDGYLEKLLKDSKEIKIRKYPIIIKEKNPEKSEKVDKRRYLSELMKLMYLAKLTRPDILYGCTFLTTFCNEPTKNEMEMISNILGYLKMNQKLPIIIRSNPEIRMYCDASHNVYRDGKGHSGCVIQYGGSVLWVSKKQKLVSGSAFEAELNSLYNNMAYLLEIYNFISEIGEKPSVRIFEDNQAVISVLKNGTGKNGSSKYLNIKINYICEVINKNGFHVQYVETKRQVADLLTKPLYDKTFYELRALL